MNKLPEPNLGVHWINEQYRLFNPADDVVCATEEVEIRSTEEFDAARALVVAKPEFFIEAETHARQYVRKLGLRNLPEIFLLKGGRELKKIGLAGSPMPLGQTDWLSRYALFRRDTVRQQYDREGIAKVGGTIVHELLHLADSRVDVLMRRQADATQLAVIRSGFLAIRGARVTGSFLDEAIPAYFAGKFVSSQIPARPEQSMGQPALTVPSHYMLRRPDATGKHGSISGPEGYAMELLMYASERRGIMSEPMFESTLIQTCPAKTKARAMRRLVSAINQIEPGLYGKLRELQYGYDEWRQGCKLVYDAVTRNPIQ